MAKKLLIGLAPLLAVAALALTPALASAEPTVETKPASSITTTEATLNGVVKPEGAEVTFCNFEYGTTPSLGKSAACQGPPAATFAPVTGLTPNTTYVYRIFAVIGGIGRGGSDVTFKTLPPPPTVETEAASAVKPHSATLNASVNPNGAEVTECELEYGTTTSYGQSAPCTPSPGPGTEPVAVSASITGLTANTTYHYRVSATNVNGTSTGSDVTFSTIIPPHYYVNGERLTASAKTVIGWGNITLKGTKGSLTGGHVTCHTVVAGTLLNPAGEGAGEGLTQVFASFQCEQEQICPTKTTRLELVAEKLPWRNLLTEEVAGTIRQETTGTKGEHQMLRREHGDR